MRCRVWCFSVLSGELLQFDALFEKLTAREHLMLYATIRGVPKTNRKTMVDRIIRDLDLKDFENKLAGTYSGSRPKLTLQILIALLSQAAIVASSQSASL